MSKRRSNKSVKRMIEDCINENYGHKVCEWRYGRLMKYNWAGRRFKQGVFCWYGNANVIKTISLTASELKGE